LNSTIIGQPGEPPSEITTLAAVLQELARTLPLLRIAIERQDSPQVQPLAYRKRDAARLCSISPRLLERLLSAGKFPRADARAGKCLLWTRSTLENWLRAGGGRQP